MSVSAQPAKGKIGETKKRATRKLIQKDVIKSLRSYSGASLSEGEPSGRFRRGDQAFERGDWDAARAAYRKAKTLKRAQRADGVSVRRLGAACEAELDRGCAIESARWIERRSGNSVLDVITERKLRSEILPELLGLRQQVQERIWRRQWKAAKRIQSKIRRLDPLCRKNTCPPYVWLDQIKIEVADGNLKSAKAAAESFVREVPHGPDAERLKQSVVAWEEAIQEKERARQEAIVRFATPPAPAWFRTSRKKLDVRPRSVRWGGGVGIAKLCGGSHCRWAGFRKGQSLRFDLNIPERPQWINVDGAGTILYATSSGDLFRSRLVDATKPFTKLGKTPNPLRWDLNGSTLAVTTEDGAWVSRDSGATLQFTPFADARRALGRTDGVVVVGTHAGAHVSADGGRTWIFTKLGSMRNLRRDGDRIYQPLEGGWDNESILRVPFNCTHAELTQDARWVQPGPAEEWVRPSSWVAAFEVRARPPGPLRLAARVGPSARTDGPSAFEAIEACRRDPQGYSKKNNASGGGSIGTLGSRCSTWDCVSPLRLPPADVVYGVLGDGDCRAAKDHSPVRPFRAKRNSYRGSPPLPAMCDASLGRTMVRVDTTGFYEIPKVPDCRLAHLASVGSKALAVCKTGENRADLVLLDDNGTPHDRISVTGVIEGIMAASDGTLVVDLSQGGVRRAAIRAPEPLEISGWRLASVSAAKVWRPAPGGIALAIVPSDGLTWTVKPRGRSHTGSKELTTIQSCLNTLLGDEYDGTVSVVASRKTGSAAPVISSRPAHDKVEGCFERAFQGLRRNPRRFRSARFRVQSLKTRFDVWRLAPNEEPDKIVSAGFAEGFPQQISVSDEGELQVRVPSYPARMCAVAKTGPVLCAMQ